MASEGSSEDVHSFFLTQYPGGSLTQVWKISGPCSVFQRKASGQIFSEKIYSVPPKYFPVVLRKGLHLRPSFSLLSQWLTRSRTLLSSSSSSPEACKTSATLLSLEVQRLRLSGRLIFSESSNPGRRVQGSCWGKVPGLSCRESRGKVLDEWCQNGAGDRSGVSAMGDWTSLPWRSDSLVQAKSAGF